MTFSGFPVFRAPYHLNPATQNHTEHIGRAQGMDPEHLEHVLAATSDVAWCHFECRQPGVAQMLEMLRRRTPTTRPWVSLEIEKPGLETRLEMAWF